MSAALRSFIRDEQGLTAIECAAILAVLIPLTFAFAEIQRYNRFARHLWATADGIATLVAARGTPFSGPALTEDSAAFPDLFPEGAGPLGSRWRDGVGVQATLVRFAPSPETCVGACSYPGGEVVWTWSGGTLASRGLLQRAGLLRSCGSLTPASSAQPNASTLAREAFGPRMRIVIDLVFVFRPMLVSDVLTPRLMVWQGHKPVAVDLGDVSGLSDEVRTCS